MTSPHLVVPSGTSRYGGRWQQLRPAGPIGPHRNLQSWNDNTVGPVTLASGYGSNTFPYSAAHVLDPSMMSSTTHVVTDTRKCEPNASDTSSVPPKTTSFTSSTLEVTQNKKDTSPNLTFFTIPSKWHFSLTDTDTELKFSSKAEYPYF